MGELWRTGLEINKDIHQKKYGQYLSTHSKEEWKSGSKYTEWFISK